LDAKLNAIQINELIDWVTS
jgi:hypothetical protein